MTRHGIDLEAELGLSNNDPRSLIALLFRTDIPISAPLRHRLALMILEGIPKRHRKAALSNQDVIDAIDSAGCWSDVMHAIYGTNSFPGVLKLSRKPGNRTLDDLDPLDVGRQIHKHHDSGDTVTEAIEKAADVYDCSTDKIKPLWIRYRRIYFNLLDGPGVNITPHFCSLQRRRGRHSKK